MYGYYNLALRNNSAWMLKDYFRATETWVFLYFFKFSNFQIPKALEFDEIPTPFLSQLFLKNWELFCLYPNFHFSK